MNKKVFVILMHLYLCNPFLSATVNVLIYGDNSDLEAEAFFGMDGFHVVWTKSLDSITIENLSDYDVFFAGSSYGNDLDSKASILQEYMMGGGGIVVGQSNISGFIDWLPSELSVFVHSISYPNDNSFRLTPSGEIHPIFNGLESYNLGTGPADTIYIDDLAPTWNVLAVFTPNPTIVGMAANHYGNSRILLWPDTLGPKSVDLPPSDICIQQAFEWVAVPEPCTVLLLGLGGFLVKSKSKM